MSTKNRSSGQGSFPGGSVLNFSIVWLFLSAILIVWDAGFILLRPRSLPGGDLHHFWKPYVLYINVDKAYGDMEDSFVIAQAWLNVVEVFLSFAAVVLLLRQRMAGLLLGFLVSAFTFWKTMIYVLQYTALCNGSDKLAHTTWNELIFLFAIPDGVWLVFPFFCIMFFGHSLTSLLNSKSKKA